MLFHGHIFRNHRNHSYALMPRHGMRSSPDMRQRQWPFEMRLDVGTTAIPHPTSTPTQSQHSQHCYWLEQLFKCNFCRSIMGAWADGKKMGKRCEKMWKDSSNILLASAQWLPWWHDLVVPQQYRRAFWKILPDKSTNTKLSTPCHQGKRSNSKFPTFSMAGCSQFSWKKNHRICCIK